MDKLLEGKKIALYFQAESSFLGFLTPRLENEGATVQFDSCDGADLAIVDISGVTQPVSLILSPDRILGVTSCFVTDPAKTAKLGIGLLISAANYCVSDSILWAIQELLNRPHTENPS